EVGREDHRLRGTARSTTGMTAGHDDRSHHVRTKHRGVVMNLQARTVGRAAPSALALITLILCPGGGHVMAAIEKKQSWTAEVNGTTLYYETAGEGPAIVLIHGGLVDSRLWDDQMKALAKHHRVVRDDLRGFGRSAEAPEPFSHIEDLRALMDFLRIERAT